MADRQRNIPVRPRAAWPKGQRGADESVRIPGELVHRVAAAGDGRVPVFSVVAVDARPGTEAREVGHRGRSVGGGEWEYRRPRGR